MFSGIVEALGKVAELRDEPPGCTLVIREPKIAEPHAVLAVAAGFLRAELREGRQG